MADRRVVLAAVAWIGRWLAIFHSPYKLSSRARKSGRVFVGIDLGGTMSRSSLYPLTRRRARQHRAHIPPGARSPEAVVGDHRAHHAEDRRRLPARSAMPQAFPIQRRFSLGVSVLTRRPASPRSPAAFEGWADATARRMLGMSDGDASAYWTGLAPRVSRVARTDVRSINGARDFESSSVGFAQVLYRCVTMSNFTNRCPPSPTYGFLR